jgi:VanZ family protein
MPISIEDSILLPGETIIWQGYNYKTNYHYPRYFLTDERLIVQTSKISYESFDLSQIVAIEKETLKNYTLLTLTLAAPTSANLTLKLDNLAELETEGVYRQLMDSRARSLQKIHEMGEQLPIGLEVSGVRFVLYHFIRANAQFLVYFLTMLSVALVGQLQIGRVGAYLVTALMCITVVLFMLSQNLRLYARVDLGLRRIILRVSGTEKLIVPRKVAVLSTGLTRIFWFLVVLAIFLALWLLNPYVVTK